MVQIKKPGQKHGQKPGQLLCIGLKGPYLSQQEKQFIEEEEIFGIILFKRNIVSITQCYELCCEIKSLKPSPLITIDREGGTVDRLKHITQIGVRPSACDLSFLTLEEIKQSAYFYHRELYHLGVDINFAPCLDVETVKSTLFQSRLFAKTPKEVMSRGRSFLSGAKKAQIISCVKHFPGHGGVKADSHHTLPVDNRSFKDIYQQLEVFQSAINLNTECIMTAHVLYTYLDAHYPATFSKKILDKLLRKTMKFKGLIISDDMNMKAVSSFFKSSNNSSKESRMVAAVKALKAGVDILLYGENPPFTLPGFLRKNFKKIKDFPTKVQRAQHLKTKILSKRKKTSLKSANMAIKKARKFYLQTLKF